MLERFERPDQNISPGRAFLRFLGLATQLRKAIVSGAGLRTLPNVAPIHQVDELLARVHPEFSIEGLRVSLHAVERHHQLLRDLLLRVAPV